MSKVTCPSGLVVEVRRLKNKEIDILTDKKAVRKGTIFQQILEACCTVAEPGPYSTPNGQPFSWANVLIADQTVALFEARCQTFGPEYDLDLVCAECRSRIEWTVDLSELEVVPLSEETRATFAIGNRFEVVEETSGKKVWFQLTTGAMVQKLQPLMEKKQNKIWTLSLNAKILEIEGVSMMERKKFLDNMDAGDTLKLRDAFEEFEGGIDTDILVECENCWAKQEVSLPLGPTLFLPRKKKGKGARREADDMLR